jgi:hypothetical protein
MRLYIAGGYHITRPEKRIEAIEEALGDVDVVFVEAPRSDSPGIKTVMWNLFSVPVLVMTMYLWVGILTVWAAVVGKDDQQVVTHLSEAHGAEVVHTDQNVHRLLVESRHLWVIGHGIVVLLAALAIPEFVDRLFTFTTLWMQLLTLTLFTGLGLFVLFLAGTLQSRNAKMARDIEQYAVSHEIVTACLITGGHHASGIKRILEENPNISLVEAE